MKNKAAVGVTEAIDHARKKFTFPFFVRSPVADPGKWAAALSGFVEEARELAGSQVLDYDLDGLRRKAGPRSKVGRDFWTAVRGDAVVLVGSQLDELIEGV
ncbi:MAG: hypothetical protein ACYCSF_11425 [Acidimicrobiales bacterium]